AARSDPRSLMADGYEIDDPGEDMPESVRVAFLAALPRDLARIRDAFDANAPDGLFRAAHDIKGQAPLFGYGLVAAVATALAELTRGRTAFDPARRTCVQAHVEALETLVANDIKGGGGDLGRALLAELEIRRQAL
ncbi:MAG: Hpt domain-containing protein, partial [Tagaea sp.]|nr:Hpt domain-containing protein [Tagaea sp.]